MRDPPKTTSTHLRSALCAYDNAGKRTPHRPDDGVGDAALRAPGPLWWGRPRASDAASSREAAGRSQDPEDPELVYGIRNRSSFLFHLLRQCNKAAAAPAHGLKAMNIDEQAMAEARQAMMEEDSDEASEKDETRRRRRRRKRAGKRVRTRIRTRRIMKCQHHQLKLWHKLVCATKAAENAYLHFFVT